jgi:hypothetical protein
MSSGVWGRGEGGRSSASNGIGQGARGLQPRGRPSEQEVPTVTHGMRWVGLDAAHAGACLVFDVKDAVKGRRGG